ncbi:MAG: hypothetical protein DLM72_00090 [Candidatus Nitrosopolaris wilkensis]|nr:MAG: hypothetical protein DLM72_00090 [Candidatus Nitrosopolaris wilkensis]
MIHFNKNDLAYFYIFVAVVCLFCSFPNNLVYAHQAEGNVVITDVASFTDAMGINNIVGTVENNNDVPVHVVVGQNATSSINGSSHLIIELYGKIIYPYGEVPFKFKISSSSEVKSLGKPFVYQVSKANIPYYDVIRLNYSNIPRQNGSLIGSVKNIGSFDVYDLTIYASAHNQSGAQIDSVSSHLAVLRSGERAMFTVSPDPAIMSKVSFYSCFGVDFRTMNMKINIGENRYITSNMTGLATIDNIKADPSTGTVLININNQYLVPGPLRLKIPQISSTPTIFVAIDGNLNRNAVTLEKGYTYIELNIPAGKHQVSISGIK